MNSEKDKQPATTTAPEEQSPVYSVEGAARYLGLRELGVKNPQDGIRYLVRKRRLSAIKILGRLAFMEEDLVTFLRNRQREAKRNARR